MGEVLQVILGGVIVLVALYVALRLFVAFADWHEKTFDRPGKHGAARNQAEVVYDRNKPLGSKGNPMRVKKVTRLL